MQAVGLVDLGVTAARNRSSLHCLFLAAAGCRHRPNRLHPSPCGRPRPSPPSHLPRL